MESASRILAVAPAAAPTGYGRWVRQLLGGLAAEHDVHQLVAGPSPAETCAWTVHHRDARDLRGLGTLPRLAGRLRPDLAVLLGEAVDVPSLADAARRARPGLPVAVSSAFQEGTAGLVGLLTPIDRLVTWTETAAERLRERAGADAPRIDVVPLGADARFAAPAPVSDRERRAARRRLLGPEAGGGFWVLNANQHQARKRIDLTLRGFARFARDKPPSVRLWLHMERGRGSADLLALAGTLGVADRVLPSPWPERHEKLPDERLRDLYLACDVGINTALDEGWGYVAFEHAASGAPQLVPGHGVCRELWRGAGVLLPTVERAGAGARHREVTPEGVADALEGLYADPGRRRAIGDACHRRSRRAQADRHRAAESWRRIVRQTTAGERLRAAS